jgi:hypothetical protein
MKNKQIKQNRNLMIIRAFLIFLLILTGISIISATDTRKFVLAGAGDECEDVPGCAGADCGGAVMYVFWDDDCDASNGFTSNVDNPCPPQAEPDKIMGFPQPEIIDAGRRIRYQTEPEGQYWYIDMTTANPMGSKLILGTSWDDDGWAQRGDCTVYGCGYWKGPCYWASHRIDEPNCWLYQVCDALLNGCIPVPPYSCTYPQL